MTIRAAETTAPGPWTTEHYSGTDAYSNVWSPDGLLVDGSVTWLTRDDANLISAAPDLLDALKSILDGGITDPNEVAKAHGAIAKAEGVPSPKPKGCRVSIRATEFLARETIDGQLLEIVGYINPTNDGLVAPWMMALERAQRMVGTLQTVCDAITARPVLSPAQEALQAIAAAPFEINSPAEDEAKDTVEAGRIDATRLDPIFEPILAGIRPPKST